MAESVGGSSRTDITIGVDNTGSQKTDAQHTLTVIKANEAGGIKMELNGKDVGDAVVSSEKVVTVDSGSTGTVVEVKTTEVETKVTRSENVQVQEDSGLKSSWEDHLKVESDSKRRSESPSEELVDSIEEEAFKTIERDLLTHEKDAGEEQHNDKKQNAVAQGEPSINGENNETNNDDGSTKSVTPDTDSGNGGKLEQAIGGTTAGSKDEKQYAGEYEEEEEFTGMTEDEIQAIIKKYSFMDRIARNKALRFFWGLDVERCGYFDFRMFVYYFKVQGSNMTVAELAKVYGDLDQDGDRLVSLDEFLSEMSRKPPRLYTKEELQEQFEEFDKNNDGFVDEGDIVLTLKDRGVFYTLPMVWEMLKNDRKGERKLDLYDFSRYMQDSMKKRMERTQWH